MQRAPYVLERLAAQNNLILLVELQLCDPSTGQLLRPLNSTNEANYRSLVVAFAKAYSPEYLALGVEVNALYEHSPKDYQSCAARAASPSTKVFTIFQLERMKGLQGGLFGGASGQSRSEWELLNDFQGDIVGFTTYPGLIYHNASSIPEDYYREISARTQKPAAFTEVGWQSGSLQGLGNSEAAQAQFVSTFFNITGGMRGAFSVWPFAYDQGGVQSPFNTMGLFSSQGSMKEAWRTWLTGS